MECLLLAGIDVFYVERQSGTPARLKLDDLLDGHWPLNLHLHNILLPFAPNLLWRVQQSENAVLC